MTANTELANATDGSTPTSDLFEDRIRANANDLLAYIARRVTPADAGADVLGDVFLIAWRKRESLPAEAEQARMWLFGIARNCVRNYGRTFRRKEAHSTTLTEIVEAIVPNNDPRAEDVRAALLTLPKRQRELVMLVHWDGFTIAQAGALLSVGPSTARSRYAAARNSLRTQLQD